MLLHKGLHSYTYMFTKKAKVAFWREFHFKVERGETNYPGSCVGYMSVAQFFFFLFFFNRQQLIISVIIQFSHRLFVGMSTHQQGDLNSRLTEKMLALMQITDASALVCVSGCIVAFQNVSHHVDNTCLQPDCQGTAVQLQPRGSPS